MRERYGDVLTDPRPHGAPTGTLLTSVDQLPGSHGAGTFRRNALPPILWGGCSASLRSVARALIRRLGRIKTVSSATGGLMSAHVTESATHHGVGLPCRRGLAGIGLAALGATTAVTFGLAAVSSTAVAAEVPITSFTVSNVTHNCSAGDVFLDVTVSGVGLSQKKVLSFTPKTVPSGVQDWWNAKIVTTADTQTSSIILAPEVAGDTQSDKAKEVNIVVDELADDLNTWIPDVASQTIEVPGCAPEGKPTSTSVPKPSHSAKPTIAPTHSTKPSPTQTLSLKPSPTTLVIAASVTPTPTVGAVSPPAPAASTPELPTASEPSSSAAVIESSPAVLGKGSGNSSGGGNSMPALVWGLLGAGVLGGAGFWYIRRFVHRPGTGRP
jgi:hypothetical protein